MNELQNPSNLMYHFSIWLQGWSAFAWEQAQTSPSLNKPVPEGVSDAIPIIDDEPPPAHWLEKLPSESPPEHWLKLLQDHGIDWSEASLPTSSGSPTTWLLGEETIDTSDPRAWLMLFQQGLTLYLAQFGVQILEVATNETVAPSTPLGQAEASPSVVPPEPQLPETDNSLIKRPTEADHRSVNIQPVSESGPDLSPLTRKHESSGKENLPKQSILHENNAASMRGKSVLIQRQVTNVAASQANKGDSEQTFPTEKGMRPPLDDPPSILEVTTGSEAISDPQINSTGSATSQLPVQPTLASRSQQREASPGFSTDPIPRQNAQLSPATASSPAAQNEASSVTSNEFQAIAPVPSPPTPAVTGPTVTRTTAVRLSLIQAKRRPNRQPVADESPMVPVPVQDPVNQPIRQNERLNLSQRAKALLPRDPTSLQAVKTPSLPHHPMPMATDVDPQLTLPLPADVLPAGKEKSGRLPMEFQDFDHPTRSVQPDPLTKSVQSSDHAPLPEAGLVPVHRENVIEQSSPNILPHPPSEKVVQAVQIERSQPRLSNDRPFVPVREKTAEHWPGTRDQPILEMKMAAEMGSHLASRPSEKHNPVYQPRPFSWPSLPEAYQQVNPGQQRRQNEARRQRLNREHRGN